MKTAEEYFKSRSPNGRDIPPFVAISMDDFVQICNDARNSALAEAAELAEEHQSDAGRTIAAEIRGFLIT